MTLPLQLPGRLMRTLALALGVWTVVVMAIASWKADAEVHQEMRAAMDLAEVLGRVHAQLSVPAAGGEEEVLAGLTRAVDGRVVRHLALTLRDGTGQRRWGLRDTATDSVWMRALIDLHRRWRSQSDPPPWIQRLAGPDGQEWSLVVSPSPDSERRQAVTVMLRITAWMVAALALTLLAVRWQLQRELAPLTQLLETIRRLQSGQWSPPTTPEPVRLAELESIRHALVELGTALQHAEADRRVLSERLQSIQESDRAHLSQELHDELGQRLTALRWEALVLHRRLQETQGEHGSELAGIALRLGEQLRAAQDEIRVLIRRLAPRLDETTTAEDLVRLVESLVPTQSPLSVTLALSLGSDPIPHGVALALYRMSQEAMTNALRHSKATQALLSIRRTADTVHWSFQDDGIGISDWERALQAGNGLVGLRHRAWALGGDLRVVPGSPGLRLDATLPGMPHLPTPATASPC